MSVEFGNGGILVLTHYGGNTRAYTFSPHTSDLPVPEKERENDLLTGEDIHEAVLGLVLFPHGHLLWEMRGTVLQLLCSTRTDRLIGRQVDK